METKAFVLRKLFFSPRQPLFVKPPVGSALSSRFRATLDGPQRQQSVSDSGEKNVIEGEDGGM